MALSKTVFIGEVEVTNFIIGNNGFDNGFKDIPEANFRLDSSIPMDLNYGDDVYQYINFDSDFKHFGGYISSIVTQDFFHTIIARGFAYKARETTFTGRFRQDTGNGNMKTILIAIITEKFPDWTYDDTSIPDIDYDFVTKTFNTEYVDGIFNTFADLVKRIWTVDKNKKFSFVVETTTDTGFIAQKPGNISGNIAKLKDDTRFANIVRVEGKQYPVTFKQEFVGTGTPKEYALSAFPSATTQLQYDDGTNISATLEGADDYDDPDTYDAYFKPDVPSLKFNVDTVNLDTIQVINQSKARITEEIPYADSIEFYNHEKVVIITNDYIESQDEAYNIAKNYGDAFSFILEGFEFDIQITSQQDITDVQPNNKIQFIDSKNNAFYTVTRVSVNERSSDGLTYRVVLNISPKNALFALNDILRDLNKRGISDSSGQVLTKFLYYGTNIYIENTNLSLFSQDTDDGTFILQNTDQQDNRSLMVEIYSNCDDVSSWTPNDCTLSENTDLYYVDEGHAINIVKTSAIVDECNVDNAYTGEDLTDFKFSNLFRIKDNTTLAKLDYVELRLTDSTGKYAYERMTSAEMITPGLTTPTSWNFLEVSTTTPEGVGGTGTPDFTDITTPSLRVKFNNVTDTLAEGDFIMDNFIYYDEANVVSLVTPGITYPGIMREDFTTSESEVIVSNLGNTFRERFENSEFIDSSSTGTHNESADTYTLTASEILLTKLQYKDIFNIAALLLSLDSDDDTSDLKAEFSFTEGDDWIVVPIGSLTNIAGIINFGTSPIFSAVFPWIFNDAGGTQGSSMMMRLTNEGATDITINKYFVFYNVEGS